MRRVSVPPSAIGRLLREISWEGNARIYREGGRARENVLTTEVFSALDLLPRTAFLGGVIRTASGADAARSALIAEVESAFLTLLPGDAALDPTLSATTVQPDVIIACPSVYCLVEAKRIKSTQFQKEQLAREFLVTLQEAGARVPLLLLVLGKEPPIRVQGLGRVGIFEAIECSMETVANMTARCQVPMQDLAKRVDEVVAYTTWARLGTAVSTAVDQFAHGDESVRASIGRAAGLIRSSLDWHA